MPRTISGRLYENRGTRVRALLGRAREKSAPAQRTAGLTLRGDLLDSPLILWFKLNARRHKALPTLSETPPTVTAHYMCHYWDSSRAAYSIYGTSTAGQSTRSRTNSCQSPIVGRHFFCSSQSSRGRAQMNSEADADKAHAARLRDVRDFIERVSWSSYLNSQLVKSGTQKATGAAGHQPDVLTNRLHTRNKS